MTRVAAAVSCAVAIGVAATGAPRIQVVPHEVAPRVDVLVHGKPYTSYVYLRSQPRPVLQPVYAASGAVVASEALWFGHADVNGLDFSIGGSADAGARILHRRVIEAASSDDEGQLGVEMTWMRAGDALVTVEDARFAFRDDGRSRSIDRLTRLSAVRGPVRLGHNRSAMVGVRLAEGFLDARAVVLGPEGPVNRSAAEAKRRPWLAVQGLAGGQRVTVALLDHPQNPGFPDAWRLDGSGLLAVAATSDVAIAGGRSVSFRHRFVVFAGHANRAAVEAEFQRFSASVERPRSPASPATTAPAAGGALPRTTAGGNER